MRKVLLRLMLWSLGFAAAAGVLAALSGGDETVWRVVGTGFVTALACGLMLPFSPMFDQEKTRAVGLSGVAVILVEFLLAMALIWEVPQLLFGLQWEEELGLTMLFFGLAAVLLAQARKLADGPHNRLAGRVGIGTIAVTFGVFLIAIWGPERFIDDGKWWESGNAVFTIGLLVLARINRGTGREIPVTELRVMRVTCPRCHKKQLIDIGESSCSACGLCITIQVEESLISGA
jgi:hypothetical protein